MSEPDFYLGETWIITGKATDWKGEPMSLAGASIDARVYTSLGPLIDLNLTDGVEVVNTLQGDYLVTVTPEHQDGWDPKVTVYGLQIKIVLANGTTSVQVNRHLKVDASAFVRWA